MVTFYGTMSLKLNEAIHPCILVSKLFGFAPFILVTNKKSESVYVKSNWSLFYCVTLFTGVLLALYLTVPGVFSDRAKTMTTIMETTSKLQAICGIIIFIYSHLVLFINQDKVLRIVSRMSTLGDALGMTSSRYAIIRTFLIAQMAARIAVRCVNSLLLAAGWDVPLTPEKIFAFAVICLTDVSSGVAEMHFVNFVLMLHELYSAFCARLGEVPASQTPDYLPLTLADGIHWQHSNLLNRVVHSTSAPFNKLDISFLHSCLHDVAQTVDSLFGFQNLLFIVNDFGSLLYGLYFIFDFMLGLSQPGDTTKLWVSYVVFEATLRCTRLSLMVMACSLVASKADKLAYMVSKLQTAATSAPMRQQMQTFSGQLIHRKIRFSAYDFLPIDASLISSIVGGVTTYLVIIIQFQMMTPVTRSMKNNTQATSPTL